MNQILYSSIAAFAAIFGSFLILFFHKWCEKNSLSIINFSAGVMLAIAFFHLIPESMEFNSKSAFYVLIGFLIMFFLQFILLFHPCHDDDDCQTHSNIGLTAMAGLSFHSLLDGLIIAIGFEANTHLGILTTLAIILHKIPDGITISSILLHSKISKKKILSFSFLTAIFTPIGTILGILILKNISQSLLGILIAATAGSFIFLSASDLIPETHKCKSRLAPFMLFVGVFVFMILEYICGLH